MLGSEYLAELVATCFYVLLIVTKFDLPVLTAVIWEDKTRPIGRAWGTKLWSGVVGFDTCITGLPGNGMWDHDSIYMELLGFIAHWLIVFHTCWLSISFAL